MIIAAIIVGSILAYVFMGLVVGRLAYNMMLLNSYNKYMQPFQSDSWEYCGYASREDYAYTRAKEWGDDTFAATMLGIFWFVGMFIVAGMYAKKLKGKVHIKIFPKNSVEKLIEAKQRELEEKENVKQLIAQLKTIKPLDQSTKDIIKYLENSIKE